MKRKTQKPKPKAKPHRKPRPEPLYTVNALANLLDHDRRTITKAVLKLTPAGKSRGKNLYRLADVEAVLRAKPDKTLKDEKLQEEIRKLRLRNDREEGKLISKDVVRSLVGQFHSEASKILTQKLEAELPSLVLGLDAVGIRTKGAQINDEVRAQFCKLCESFPE